MKKFSKLYTNKLDGFIFTTLIRTIKETGKYNYFSSSKNVVNCCIESRNKHTSEPYFTNISYWPMDIGPNYGMFGCVFLSRIINSLGKKASITRMFLDNYRTYLGIFVDSDSIDNKNSCAEILLAIENIKNDNVTFCFVDKDDYLFLEILKLSKKIKAKCHLTKNNSVSIYQTC